MDVRSRAHPIPIINRPNPDWPIALLPQKKVELFAGNLTSALEVIEISIEADFSQRHDDSQILETIHFAIEIRRTIREFLW